MGKRKTQEEFEEELHKKFPKIKFKGKYINGITKIPFECEIDGYKWNSTPNNTLKYGCSCCSGHYKNTDIFKKELELVNDKVEVIGEYVDSKTKILCKCLICNENFMGIPHVLLNGGIHNKCAMKIAGKNKTFTQDEFINIVENNYPGEYTILSNYTKARNKVLVKHNKCGYEWYTVADGLMHKRLLGCPKCSKVYKMTNDEYIEELSKINSTIIPKEKYVNSSTKILHKCTVCNYEWKVQPSSLLYGRGCPMCKGGTNTVVVGINDMWTTNPELAKLLSDPNDGYKYTAGTSKKVDWKCPDCGMSTGLKSIHKVKERGLYCRRCSPKRSFPNRIMYNLLTQLNIKFEDEKHFDWCKFKMNNEIKHGIYDFYFILNNKKYIVEMDGRFHSEDNKLSGQTKEESEYIDNMKDFLANKNDITVIRIDCYNSTVDYIKSNILKSELSKLLNLENVNWEKCFYNTTTPIMKNICYDYNNNMIVKELSTKYSLDVSTVMKFLDFGTTSGICNYQRNGNKRKVINLNNLEIIESINATSRRYEVSVSSIRNCCDGKINYITRIKDKEKLKFMYYDDYLKLNNKNDYEE